jgi:hypothetical protein
MCFITVLGIKMIEVDKIYYWDCQEIKQFYQPNPENGLPWVEISVQHDMASLKAVGKINERHCTDGAKGSS